MEPIFGAFVCAIYLLANFAWVETLSNQYSYLTRWEVLVCVILFPATILCCLVWVALWLWEKIDNFMSKGAW